MGLFNAIDAKSACAGRRAKHAVFALVAAAHVLTGSAAHAEAPASSAPSQEASSATLGGSPSGEALRWRNATNSARRSPGVPTRSVATRPQPRQGYFEALAASDVSRASRRALAQACTHLDESRLRAAHDDLAWAAETSENAGDPLAADVVEAAGIKNPRKTGKALAGCAPDRWTFRRLIQAWLRVPVARVEHVSALVVVVRSPRGPPVRG